MKAENVEASPSLAAPSVPWRMVSLYTVNLAHCLVSRLTVYKHKWHVLKGVYTVILCQAFCTWPPTRELHYIVVLLYPGKLTPPVYLCSCTANSSNKPVVCGFQTVL